MLKSKKMQLKPSALGTTGGGLSPSVVFQAHHKESDLNNGRKILIHHSNTGVGGGCTDRFGYTKLSEQRKNTFFIILLKWNN